MLLQMGGKIRVKTAFGSIAPKAVLSSISAMKPRCREGVQGKRAAMQRVSPASQEIAPFWGARTAKRFVSLYLHWAVIRRQWVGN